MGKEFPLAREEEEGQSVLLAITSSGERVTVPSVRDERTQEPSPPEGSGGGEVEDTKAKSQSSRKAKRANASPSKKKGRGRDNQDRESDRGDEGEDKPVRRSAQELGIVHPGSYCDKSEAVSHYWIENEKIAEGSLFRCKLCHDYIWLPFNLKDSEQLGNLIRQYGRDEGYCRFLNKHRPAKVLMAKLQNLRRLEEDVVDKREFAKMTDKILRDKNYDRKEK